jgi:hypothetical protein
MLMIDRHLVSLGCGIPQRPIAALGEVSRRYSLPLPITEPPPGTAHEDSEFWPVSARIYDWFEHAEDYVLYAERFVSHEETLRTISEKN